MSLQADTLLPDSQKVGSLMQALREVDWSTVFDLEKLLRNLLEATIVLVLAFLAYRLVRRFTRRLEREIEEPDPLLKRAREQRARTLANVLNNVALVLVLIIAGITILGIFIPIGPLLASFGILGLAVSFGAQSLVKDVITGSFMLIEGQLGIGDVVRIGNTDGMVEKITLRTTILRDIHGVVHIIPNGEITQVSNLTKTWSRAVVDVEVAYKEDVDRVLAVLRDLGRQFFADPAWRPLFIEEPEVLGVEALSNATIQIRVIAKTLPLKQWEVAREFRRRIKNRFDAEGIEIPSSRVTFYWGEGQVPYAYLPRPGDRSAEAQRPGR